MFTLFFNPGNDILGKFFVLPNFPFCSCNSHMTLINSQAFWFLRFWMFEYVFLNKNHSFFGFKYLFCFNKKQLKILLGITTNIT